MSKMASTASKPFLFLLTITLLYDPAFCFLFGSPPHQNTYSPFITKRAAPVETILHAKNNNGLVDLFDSKQLLKGTVLESKDLQLIYRASRDGWSYLDFHQKVDCGLPALVCASTKGSKAGLFGREKAVVIGGFNPFGFNSADDYRNSLKAFVFRAEAGGPLYRAGKARSAEGAIYDFGTEGPCFGVGALRIPLNPSKLPPRRASSVLGGEYVCKEWPWGSLFGERGTQGELLELEVWVRAGAAVEVAGDLGQGERSGFSWGGYGR